MANIDVKLGVKAILTRLEAAYARRSDVNSFFLEQIQLNGDELERKYKKYRRIFGRSSKLADRFWWLLAKQNQLSFLPMHTQSAKDISARIMWRNCWTNRPINRSMHNVRTSNGILLVICNLIKWIMWVDVSFLQFSIDVIEYDQTDLESPSKLIHTTMNENQCSHVGVSIRRYAVHRAVPKIQRLGRHMHNKSLNIGKPNFFSRFLFADNYFGYSRI